MKTKILCKKFYCEPVLYKGAIKKHSSFFGNQLYSDLSSQPFKIAKSYTGDRVEDSSLDIFLTS